MAKTLQFRRDTTANLASVTGAVGEIFIDTTKDTVVVMDGATAGGFPLALESAIPTDLSDLTDTTNLIPATLTDLGITDGSNGQVLTTNGSGGFTFTTATGGGGGTTYTAGSGIDITNDVISATGAANTGDFTFVGGNISLPDFQDATVNVHGNITVSTLTSSTTTYTQGEGNWDGSRSMAWDGTTLYYNDSNSNSAFGLQQLAQISAGTSITLVSAMYGTKTLVTSSAFAFNNGYMRWEATVTEYSMMMPSYQSLSFATSTTTESTSEQDFTYTFSQTGEFISDSALVGDVLISDNILTPMPLISDDSYATETDQPITINGDLEVLGNVTGALSVTGLFTSQQSAELIANVTETDVGNTGTVPLDFNSGAIFYFNNRTLSIGYGFNFTNIPKVADQVVTVTVVIKQNSNGIMPNSFYIANTDVTSSIYWSGGSAPSATANTIDVLSFSIIWVSGNTYTIFASSSNYATA